jgi:hypothetical protein
MSKQSEAKERQGFRKKPEWAICSGCEYFTWDEVHKYPGYIQEKNVRCSLGGFKVGKTDTCNMHELRARG